MIGGDRKIELYFHFKYKYNRLRKGGEPMQLDPIPIIMCVVGVIGCIIGVATFAAAALTRAKEDGVLMAKVDHLVSGFDEMKHDTKLRNATIDNTLDEHTRDITELKTKVDNLEKEVYNGR